MSDSRRRPPWQYPDCSSCGTDVFVARPPNGGDGFICYFCDVEVSDSQE